MGLVGRERELDTIVTALDQRRGVLICGEAGVGKTALAAAVTDRLGPPAVRIVATSAGRSVPLGPWRRCFRPMSRVRPPSWRPGSPRG